MDERKGMCYGRFYKEIKATVTFFVQTHLSTVYTALNTF